MSNVEVNCIREKREKITIETHQKENGKKKKTKTVTRKCAIYPHQRYRELLMCWICTEGEEEG